MLRVAEQVAKNRGIPALITGESVGQVASQTLESMAAINAVTSIPILRPLVTADKSEITSLSRRIGTYEISVQPYEDCCTLFLPPHPETRPSLASVLKAETVIDVDGLVSACVDNVETITVSPHPAATLYTGGPVMYL
jgi:thiamine biosynthesis protein ThiI